jgi:hypothetical protein
MTGTETIVPLGIVTPFENVNGFIAFRGEPTVISTLLKGLTLSDGVHSNGFFDKRIKLSKLWKSGFSPSFLSNQILNLLAQGSHVFWSYGKLIQCLSESLS